MSGINYHNRRFALIGHKDEARLGQTIFYYNQEGDLVWGTLGGGTVRYGQFLATVDAAGVLDLRYQYLDVYGELRTGISHSTPELMDDGRIRIREVYEFTSGDRYKGVSVVEEIV